MGMGDDLAVNQDTVIDVATNGGRKRWHTENQGFNTQKNSDFNLEHAYSRARTGRRIMCCCNWLICCCNW